MTARIIVACGSGVATSTAVAKKISDLLDANGYIDGVPSDWQPDGSVVNRILDGMSEDLESSATITEAIVNEVAESARFAIPMIYGDEQGAY